MTAWVFVRGLEVLRLVEAVRVGKLDLTELLFARGTTHTSDLGDVISMITCNDGDPSVDGSTTSHADRRDASHMLSLGHESRLGIHHDGLLSHDGGLLDVVRLLGDNITALSLLRVDDTSGGLLQGDR
jgi:hypothetical protein